MDTENDQTRHTVLVAEQVVPERQFADKHSADPNARGISWITGRARITEILRDACHSRNTRIQVEGSKNAFAIHLDAVRVGAAGSMSGAVALECSTITGDFVDGPCVRDISSSGLRLALPANVQPPLGERLASGSVCIRRGSWNCRPSPDTSIPTRATDSSSATSSSWSHQT